MRTCFVHIGMHKTGSTAIQTALHGYNDGKTAVLQTGKPNHSTPLLMMFSADPRRAAERIGIRAGRLDDRLQSLRQRIVSQFEASQSNFILSGEGLSSDLTSNEIAELKAFLARWFDDIRIIVYLREPAPYMRSAFQQSAKGTSLALDLSPFRPQYRMRIDGWIDTNGPNL